MSFLPDNSGMEIVHTEEFEQWLAALRNPRAIAAIVSRIRRMEDGNFGDHYSVGGVSELRINIGPGCRVYYTIRRRRAGLPPCGGDKSRQRHDIRLAQRIAGQV